MTWSFEELQDAEITADGAASSARRPQRRTVLKGMLASAAAVGWSALSWSAPAYAETGPGGLRGWDRNDCKDAYPGGYTQKAPTDGSSWPAACFGSDQIGPSWCTSSSNGWSKSGRYSRFNGWDQFTPSTTACSGKNAWRWTASGHVYRCSDGNYTYNVRGDIYGPYFYQCQSRVS